MDNIREWALEYCGVENITYDELVMKALELYKNYSSNHLELYKYVTSSEFRNVIEKTHRLLRNSDNSLYTKVICTVDSKKKYLESNEFEAPSCIDLINKNGTEIIVVQTKSENIAFAIVSYENEEGELGKYPFLHNLRILKDEHRSKFTSIEKTLVQYIKRKGYDYYDRIIDGDIKEKGFQVVYNIYNIKLNISEAPPSCLEYAVEEAEVDRFMYELEAKRSPERFSCPKGRYKKVALEDGADFFICSITRNKRALLSLKLMKEKKNDFMYLKKVLTAAVTLLREENVDEIYSTVSGDSYHILKSLGKLEVISKEHWIRKIL